jgi:hypothetical protein
MPESGEIVVALPASGALHPVRNVRSTVLLGSVKAVRATGQFAAYERSLLREHKDTVLHAVAGTWIPVEVAAAHYDACDAAGFSEGAAFANGRHTFESAGNVIFGNVLTRAKSSGVTPWALLEQFPRFWERSYDGGAVGVNRVGPKEARVHILRSLLLESAYYRSALRGVVASAIDLLSVRAYVVEKPGLRPSGTVTLRVQWA